MTCCLLDRKMQSFHFKWTLLTKAMQASIKAKVSLTWSLNTKLSIFDGSAFARYVLIGPTISSIVDDFVWKLKKYSYILFCFCSHADRENILIVPPIFTSLVTNKDPGFFRSFHDEIFSQISFCLYLYCYMVTLSICRYFPYFVLLLRE